MNDTSTPESGRDGSAGPFANLGQTPQVNAEPPPQASDVGTLLCATRMRVGKDLQDVAAVLHIRYNFLVAIEDGRYEDLPGQAYAIGFVRAYADHLGLDGDEVVRRYKEETAGIKRVTRYEYPIPPPESGIPSGALLLIAVVLGMVVYGVWYTMADADRRAADVIQEVPDRLAALLRDDTATTPTSNQQVADAAGSEEAPLPEAEDQPVAEPTPVPAASPPAANTPAVSAPVAANTSPATPAPTPAPVAPTAQEPAKVPVAAPAASAPVVAASTPAPQQVKPEPQPKPAAPAVVASSTPPPAASLTAPVAPVPAPTTPATTVTPSPTAATVAPPKPAVVTPTAPPAESSTPVPTPTQTAQAPAATTQTPAAQKPAVQASPVQTAAVPAAPKPESAKPTPAATTPAATTSSPVAQTVPPVAAPSTATPAVVSPAKPQVTAVTPLPTPSAPQTATPSAAAPTTTAAVPAPKAPKPETTKPSASGKNANVELRAKSDSWIQVRDGEQLLLTRFLRKGETYKVPDRTGLTLMTLNAGGVEVIVDGAVMPPLGDQGSVARGVSLDGDKLKAQAKPTPSASRPDTPAAND